MRNMNSELSEIMIGQRDCDGTTSVAFNARYVLDSRGQE